MPIDITPVQIEHVSLDEEPLLLGLDEINEKYALELVKETFYQYEQFRSQYHDSRWNISDTLFFGWQPGKVWEGTAIPRASLGYPLVYDQVESALPAISQEIFAPQDEWFNVEAEPGTDVNEARQVQEHLSYVLEHSKNDFSLSARNELELCFKDILLYGNGGIGIEYDSILQRPIVEWVDLRDFYIDPGCPTPNVDNGRSIIRRKFYTVDELISLRKDSRMKIPEDGVLYHMSRNALFAVGDQTKRNQEAIRGVPFTPNTSDYSVYPADRKIECLIYYSNARIIWILNRQHVAYNQPNPYGFIPFCFAPYSTVPSRFYAQSIADVQEGNQRYIEALLNGHLDAVSLEIQPPRIYKSGTMMTPAQLKWRPGAMYQTSDVKDMSLLQPTTQMANIFTDIAFLESAAEKRSGLNSMMSGIPRPSNTNRTATGVSAISSGSMTRLRQTVSNIENYLIIPMLYKLYTIIQKHTLPGQELNGIHKNGSLTKVNSNSFQNKMRFRMLASSRMMTKDKLAAMFPFLMQYMLNGTFIGNLHQAGKTIDFGEVSQLLRDATGTGKLYNLIRDLTPQESQQLQQQSQQEVIQQQQADKSEQDTRKELMQMKTQTELQVAQIGAPNPQMEQQTAQMDMAREGARIKSEQMLAQIKASAEKEKMQMQAAAKQQELQGKQQELGLKLKSDAMSSALQLQTQQQQAALDAQQGADLHSQTLQQGSETHQQNLQNLKSQGEMQIAMRKRAEVRKKEKGPS